MRRGRRASVAGVKLTVVGPSTGAGEVARVDGEESVQAKVTLSTRDDV